MFSFHATKVFNTIEGGAVTFKEDLVQKMNDLKNFGIRGPERVAYVGGNAKMSEFQASMGICNLRHVDEEIAKRKAVVEHYRARLSGIPGIHLCGDQPGVIHNYAYFPVVFDGYKLNRDEVSDKLAEHNIIARKYFYPLTNDVECYADLPTAGAEKTPLAKHISDSILTLPLYADLALEDVAPTLQRQLDCNLAIAREGLTNAYGARIGQVLLAARGNDVVTRAKAMAAAASDARMGGCELPVVINSGSGNQGITASLPVAVYAQELGATQELLYRALVVSNLVTLHLKSGIGPLSAYCGAISAGCGAAAGITYLYGGKFRDVAHTVVNALAINSGVICDGAKASCAAKIASAVEAGLLGMDMFRQGSQFLGGDGIVSKGVENTIRNVSRLASQGMRDTDSEIIRIMLEQ